MEARAINPPIVEESVLARRIFAETGPASIFWLLVRLYLGYEWLVAGWGKVTDGAWMRGGAALQGYATGAIESSSGEHPAVAYGWYVNFLEWIRDSAHVWMAPLVAVGEVAIGLALLVGAFVGVAAFLGVVLNFSFVFAGSAGVNPLFLVLGLLLVLAWRNAGWFGLDRWLLPMVGTPARRIRERRHDAGVPVTTQAAKRTRHAT